MNVEQSVPVLVAEDSEDNQFLLQAYCRGTAFNLNFVEDGEQAVSAYQAGCYQIIIMDVQMPVMDGLSATRLIRKLEFDVGAKRTPILALTANVMPHDVVLAREAGCDIHLPKPISRKSFLSALEEWKPAPGPVAPSIRIEIEPGLEQLAVNYLAARHKELPLLRELHERFAFDEIQRLAQNLKGTGTSYGYPDITRLGSLLERSAAFHDFDGLARQLSELANFLQAASQQIQRSADRMGQLT